MEDPASAPTPTSATRAAWWAALFGGAGVLLLVLVLLLGFTAVLLLIHLFLQVVGQPVALHQLYADGGDAALHGLLGAHLALLVAVALASVLVAWLVLAVLRRWEEVRRWWPSMQGLLAAGTSYALVAVAALVVVVLRSLLG